MPKHKILTVIGARPQFIKASALSRAILKSKKLEEIIVHTGQHFDTDMSDVFFEQLSIPKPKHVLKINSLNHSAMTGRMMEAIENIIELEKPKLLLVYGDTNSTLAAALSASKLNVPVAHVEAGLRSNNMLMPEEQNRRICDLLSTLLFCPSQDAARNLSNENLRDSKVTIDVVGDVMQDAFNVFLPFAGSDALKYLPKDFALCTLHRAENTNDKSRMDNFINAINRLANEKFPIVWPVHPRAKKLLENYTLSENIHCIKPASYLDMLAMLKQCSLVMTDSGGLQKEANFAGKHCITLRSETEWIELVNEGQNHIVDDKVDLITEKAIEYYGVFFKAKPIYGNGNACSKITTIIEKYLDKA